MLNPSDPHTLVALVILVLGAVALSSGRAALCRSSS